MKARLRDPLLTVREVADRLRVNPETVRVMARRGDLESLRVGKGRTAAYRFPESAIDQYLDDHKTATAA